MSVDTKSSTGRRELHFHSYSDIDNDARQIVSAPHRTLGNWSAGQILMHLARSLDASIDGAKFKIPWHIRTLARLFYKNRILRGPMPAGFQITGDALEQLAPGPTEVEAGLSALHDAILRVKSQAYRAPHGVFGKLTREQWDQLHLRHAEMHLSFIVPDEEAA